MSDDTSAQELPVLDEEPKGDFIDIENFFEDITEEEIAEGNHLGETIDTDDDDDTGARETYR